MLKIRTVLHLICWAYKEIKLLFYIFSKRHFDSSEWEKKKDPQSSTVLLNVSLFVGAPVRVYLHGLVRRLLYSHLTPSTLSSPSLPPSSVLQCTSILTLRLLLPHRSMGEYAWCYDRCMSAALPWETPPIESLSSLCLWGLETQRRATFRKPPHLQKKSVLRLLGHSAEALFSLGWICVGVGGLFWFFFTRCSFGKPYCTNIHTNACHIGEYCAIDSFWLDLCEVIISLI